MAERAFVLAPLADIIPTYIHPVTGQTIQAMLDQVDLHSVERLGEIPFPLMMEPGSALA
jgi:7,8-dihydro-6-hydroxymethylpterin-pyrophosphokinase